MTIQYVLGNALSPLGEGDKAVIHCCNNIGAWGAGFTKALSDRWSGPENAYRNLHKSKGLSLGAVQIVQVEESLYVCNLIGQEGIRGLSDIPPIRYEAIRLGFNRIAKKWEGLPVSLHMPRIGAGLAGGDWALIEPLIEACFIRKGFEVTVYDLKAFDYFDSRL